MSSASRRKIDNALADFSERHKARVEARRKIYLQRLKEGDVASAARRFLRSSLPVYAPISMRARRSELRGDR